MARTSTTPIQAGLARSGMKVQMPEAEIGELIVEIRSATAGVGSFTFRFDHMAELTGRNADQIIAARKAAAVAA